MRPKRKTYYRRFMEMSDAQRDAEVAQFDKEAPGVPGKPLTTRDQVLHRKAGLKVGRPRVGQGAERVLITVERGLLRKADSYAKRRGMSRSELIAHGLKYILGDAA